MTILYEKFGSKMLDICLSPTVASAGLVFFTSVLTCAAHTVEELQVFDSLVLWLRRIGAWASIDSKT